MEKEVLQSLGKFTFQHNSKFYSVANILNFNELCKYLGIILAFYLPKRGIIPLKHTPKRGIIPLKYILKRGIIPSKHSK